MIYCCSSTTGVLIEKSCDHIKGDNSIKTVNWQIDLPNCSLVNKFADIESVGVKNNCSCISPSTANLIKLCNVIVIDLVEEQVLPLLQVQVPLLQVQVPLLNQLQ